jgi:hypothetical protein
MGYLKIIIPIIIIGIIAGAIAVNSEQEIVEEETEIQWRSSGPFSIEKYEYYLGEKIFITVREIPKDVRGEILILKPTSTPNLEKFEGLENIPKEMISTKTKYLEIEFDGSKKNNFNRYFEPKLIEWKNICSGDDLKGEWVLIFSGTEYEPIIFEVINEIAPWYEKEQFEPIC